MENNQVTAALMMRLPKRVSWLLGIGDQSNQGRGWWSLLDVLAAHKESPATLSLTFLLKLDGQTETELDGAEQHEGEQ